MGKKMGLGWILLLLAVAFNSSSYAEIYRTVDKDGNVIFTDRPGKGASEVKLPPINTTSIPEASPYSNAIAPPDTPTATAPDYQVHIISPRDNVTIPPGQRDLAIAVSLSTPLQPTHYLVYYINGEAIQESESTSIVIQDITRGEHRLSVEVIDAQGTVLAQSPVKIVNVIRPSILNPNHPQFKPTPK